MEPKQHITKERVGVIGDVHAEDQLLAEAVDFLKSKGAQTILCTGDICDGPGDLERTITLLEHHSVLSVRGNHDRWFAEDKMRNLPHAHSRHQVSPEVVEYLVRLKPSLELTHNSDSLLLCHGLADNDMELIFPDDSGYALDCKGELDALIAGGKYHIVIAGHSHKPMVRNIEGLFFVNPGTLTRECTQHVLLLDLGILSVELYQWNDGSFMPPETTAFADLRNEKRTTENSLRRLLGKNFAQPFIDAKKSNA